MIRAGRHRELAPGEVHREGPSQELDNHPLSQLCIYIYIYICIYTHVYNICAYVYMCYIMCLTRGCLVVFAISYVFTILQAISNWGWFDSRGVFFPLYQREARGGSEAKATSFASKERHRHGGSSLALSASRSRRGGSRYSQGPPLIL